MNLEITTDNCKYIKLNSDYIKDIINNPLYEKIEINLKVNCAEEYINYNIDLDSNPDFWTLDIAQNKAKNDILDCLTLTHIISDKSIVEDSLNIDINTLTDVILEGIIVNLLTINGLDATNVTVTIVGDIITVSGLPENVVMDNFKYTTTNEIFKFTYKNNSEYAIISDYIYIKPEFFDNQNLIEGVYNIKLKYIKTDGSYIEESQCSFIDCGLKCKIASLLDDYVDSMNPEINKDLYLQYFALIESGNCGGCNCEELCIIYDNIIDYINIPNIKNKINTKDCCNGCY